MPEWMINDLKTLGISAAITWGLIQAAKPALKLRGVGGEKNRLIIRLFSVLFGLLVGAIVHPALVQGPIGPGAIVGAGLGAAAGGLNAAIVGAVKARLKIKGEL